MIGNTWQLTRVHALSLLEWGSITSMPQWFGELTSLERLEIGRCEGIGSLPDSIQQLTGLKHACKNPWLLCPNEVAWLKGEQDEACSHQKQGMCNVPAKLSVAVAFILFIIDCLVSGHSTQRWTWCICAYIVMISMELVAYCLLDLTSSPSE